MERTSRTVVIPVILGVLIAVSACDLGGSGSLDLGIPQFPKALTGDPQYVPSRNSREGEGNTPDIIDKWYEVYGNYIVVPQIGHNYNFFIDVVTPFLEQFSGSKAGWIELEDNPYFTKEYRTTVSGTVNIDGFGEIEYFVPIVYRTNQDNSFFEVFFFSNDGETRVLTVRRYPGYTHAVLFMHNTSGNVGKHDSVEILQSDSIIVTKCIRVSSYEDSYRFEHFISITDRRTEDNDTSGMMESSFGDGTPVTLDAAYFSDSRKRLSPDDIPEGYEFPDIEGHSQMLFFSGLSSEMIYSLVLESFDPESGVDEYEAGGSIESFTALEWDEQLLQELRHLY